jgi:putative radical SAM enzyme (TIGR03279 family)
LESERTERSGRLGRPIGAPGDLIADVGFTGTAARQAGTPASKRGGVVESVDPGSPAERVGIRTGDVITAVNGHRLRDVVDYQFHSAGALVTLEVLTDAGEHRALEILKDERQSIGIMFTQPTFAPIRECNNHCPFCFIDQLPGEMRSSLYIRDDDYRYSFLFGNFVTLTNLNESDWSRLAEQRLSPLYVSVHATEPRLRRVLLGNNRAPDILVQLKRLFDCGINVHTQVVVCPSLNDGDALTQTVGDLSALYPNVLSIGIVPVGLTRTPEEILSGPGASCSRILPSARDLNLRTMGGSEAAAIIKQVRRWQRASRVQHGPSLVYASDEIYILAGKRVPAASTYDDYPQYENGIGMVRDLLDDWSRTRRRLMAQAPFQSAAVESASLVCGEMIAPILEPLVEEWSAISGIRAELVPIRNTFFGPRVKVSGLLAGRDVLANRRRLRGEVIILPEVMLDKTGSRLLDGVTPAELEAQLERPIGFAGEMSRLVSLVSADTIAA